MKLRDCYDEAGDLDIENFVVYKKKREEAIEEEVLQPVPPNKMPFRNRNNNGYDPNDCLESKWYRRYIRFPDDPLHKKHMKLF